MKNTIIALLLGIFGSINLAAQCDCLDYDITEVPDSVGLFELRITRVAACNFGGLVNDVTLFANDPFSEFYGITPGQGWQPAAMPKKLWFENGYTLEDLPLNEPNLVCSFRMSSSSGSALVSLKIQGPPPLVGLCNFPSETLAVPVAPTFAYYFSNKCGDAPDNIVKRVKGYGTNTYVLSTREVAGKTFSVFTKYNTMPAVDWQIQIDSACVMEDFEYSPADNSFLLVGRNDDVQSGGVFQNNRSFIFKIDNATGTTLGGRKYDETGSETFTRIIRHPNPLNPAFPFYVLGYKNPTGSTVPDYFTTPMLWNIDQNLAGNWHWEYVGPQPFEGHFGLFPKANGNVVFLGETSPNNQGILVEVAGASGFVARSRRYNDASGGAKFDFWDGRELPGGDIAIVGTDFNNLKGFLMKLSPTYSFISGMRFDNISQIHELGMDNSVSPARLYFTGPADQVPDFPVVTRVLESGTGFTVGPSQYLFDGESDFSEPHISVTPALNNIFYADSRKKSTPDFDLLVGAYDLNLGVPGATMDCRTSFSNPTTAFTLSDSPISIQHKPFASSYYMGGVDFPLSMPCANFCAASNPPCSVDFQWATVSTLCHGIAFSASATGTPPFTYNWSFGGMGPSPTFSFPTSGPVNVCVTVTDATGCTATICHVVQPLLDLAPPLCAVPSDFTVDTDSGRCYSFQIPNIIASDNCGSVMLLYNLTGATIGSTLPTNFNKGTTTVQVRAIDPDGNVSFCSFNVTVVDNEPPIIVCPMDVVVPATFCSAGAVVTFPPPTVSDNCPMVSYTCSHVSGSVFPCGTTLVTCTATDMSGLTSICTFNVTVNCPCATLGTATIACDPTTDDKYLFSIPFTSLTGAASCSAIVLGTSQPGVTVMTTDDGSTTGVALGMITVTGGVIPATFNLEVNISCVCTNGVQSSCTLPISLTPICCRKIKIEPQSVCAEDLSVSVPLVGCSAFSCISLVNYYVATGPTCPPFTGAGSAGWSLAQSQPNCLPLVLFPYLYTDNIWVVAEMTVCNYPCSFLTSNVACITLCKKATCTVSMNQEFCYTGSPISPGALTATILPASSTDCPASITSWSGPGVSGSPSGSVFSPPSLSLPAGFVDCWKDFTFTATVMSLCGPQTCSASIRLFNDAAANGNLVMAPDEPQPFCPGEDATLLFKDFCASHPPASPTWSWCISTDGTTFVPLAGSGTANPLWNTNQLFQDTWYQVKSANGVCAEKKNTFFIDVLDLFSISGFSATLVSSPPDCEAMGVDLSVDIAGIDASCPANVKWIKDGIVIGSGSFTSSPATWTFINPALLGDYSGNYCVIVERTCCGETLKSDVVTIDPPCFLEITGPCFIKIGDVATLYGELKNPPVGVVCTVEWFDPLGNSKGSGVNPITVSISGDYTFVVTCSNGCIKRGVFTLVVYDCSVSCFKIVDADEPLGTNVGMSIIPNPTTGLAEIVFEKALSEDVLLQILNTQGRLISQKTLATGSEKAEVDLSSNPSGVYFLKINTSAGKQKTVKVVLMKE